MAERAAQSVLGEIMRLYGFVKQKLGVTRNVSQRISISSQLWLLRLEVLGKAHTTRLCLPSPEQCLTFQIYLQL